VFRILEIVVNFKRVTCIFYAGLMEILNSQLRYNFSWASYTRQQRKTLSAIFLSNSTFLLCRHMLLLS